MRRRRRRGGFTLIEAALTTVIVGTGVLAIVAAQQAYHIKNNWAQRTGTGLLLANEIRELTLSLPLHDPITGDDSIGAEPNEPSIEQYDDLDDFAGNSTNPIGVDGKQSAATVFDPPRNALREVISDMTGWSQEVWVEAVSPDNLGGDGVGDTYGLDELGTLMRVTVRVLYQKPQADEPMEIARLRWVVGD